MFDIAIKLQVHMPYDTINMIPHSWKLWNLPQIVAIVHKDAFNQNIECQFDLTSKIFLLPKKPFLSWLKILVMQFITYWIGIMDS